MFKTSSKNISNIRLTEASIAIEKIMGLNFASRLDDLESGIINASRELKYKSTDDFIYWLLTSHPSQEKIELLAGYLTIGETHFFRIKGSMDYFENFILPEISQKYKEEKNLRIWSAGCATGEEPYSIAIIINKLGYLFKDWNISIIATDINPIFIKKALAGIYNNWSFRGTPKWVIEGYFEKRKPDIFAIVPKIKEMVTFSYINLAKDDYPLLVNNTNAMNVIFCRNVLMYFSEEMARQIYYKFSKSLLEDGWLVTGPSDTLNNVYPAFKAVRGSGVSIFKKENNKHKVEISEKLGFLPVNTMQYIEPDKSYESIKPHLQKKIKLPSAPVIVKTENNIIQKKEETKIIQKPIADSSGTKSLYLKAYELYSRGQYEEALSVALIAESSDDNYFEIALLITKIYSDLGKLEEGHNWCTKAISLNKTNPTGYYLLAQILLEQGQTMQSIAMFKKSLYLNPESIMAYFAIGNIMVSVGKINEAKKYFRNVKDSLSLKQPDEIIEDSEGISAERLLHTVNSIIEMRFVHE